MLAMISSFTPRQSANYNGVSSITETIAYGPEGNTAQLLVNAPAVDLRMKSVLVLQIFEEMLAGAQGTISVYFSSDGSHYDSYPTTVHNLTGQISSLALPGQDYFPTTNYKYDLSKSGAMYCKVAVTEPQYNSAPMLAADCKLTVTAFAY